QATCCATAAGSPPPRARATALAQTPLFMISLPPPRRQRPFVSETTPNEAPAGPGGPPTRPSANVGRPARPTPAIRPAKPRGSARATTPPRPPPPGQGD